MYNNPFQPQQPAANMPPVPPANFGQQPAQAQNPAAPKKDNTNLIKNCVIAGVSVLAVTFLGLFIWKFVEYTDIKENMDSKIDLAVAEATDEQAERLEKEFAEREKYPYQTFAGPADYGELSFQYPKTWSVYIAKDASNGGDFEAYLTPVEVEPISGSNINAVRVKILDDDYESIIKKYQRELERKDSDLKVETITVNGVAANRYTGTLPDTDDLNGYVVIFKIRDKTALIQTDSMLFESDFNALLLSVKFNA